MYFRDLHPERKATILLLHGQVFDGRLFDRVAPSLEGHRVLIPDLPGHGLSAGDIVPAALADVQGALEQALAERGITELKVMGYSMGSWHALGLALRRKVKVTRLFLLGPFPGADAAVLAQFAGLAGVAQAGQLDWTQVFFGNCFPAAWAAAHPATAAATKQEIRAGSASTLLSELTKFPGMEDFRARGGELDMPVRVRVGDADPSTPLAPVQGFVGAIAKGELEVVPGVAHHYFAQDFEATVASLKGFLEQP
jgi:pimeloyl-ACP methyl ester carboxylesterase